MVKTKNDAVVNNENPTETRPTKKARIIDTGEIYDIETRMHMIIIIPEVRPGVEDNELQGGSNHSGNVNSGLQDNEVHELVALTFSKTANY